jgi:hypothetical protein
VDESVEGLASRPKFHQHINIAFLTLLAPSKRTKDAKSIHSESLDLVLMRVNKQQQVFFCLCDHGDTSVA